MAPRSLYVPSALAPSTETGSAVLCSQCGVLVADQAAHDGFHALLRQLVPAKLKAGTRAK
jgi:hypothetical protein